MENSLLRPTINSLSSAFFPWGGKREVKLLRIQGGLSEPGRAFAHLVLGFIRVKVSIFVVLDDGSGRQLVQELDTQTDEEGVFLLVTKGGAEGRRLTVPLVFCSSLVDTMVRSSLPLRFPQRVACRI